MECRWGATDWGKGEEGMEGKRGVKEGEGKGRERGTRVSVPVQTERQ